MDTDQNKQAPQSDQTKPTPQVQAVAPNTATNTDRTPEQKAGSKPAQRGGQRPPQRRQPRQRVASARGKNDKQAQNDQARAAKNAPRTHANAKQGAQDRTTSEQAGKRKNQGSDRPPRRRRKPVNKHQGKQNNRGNQTNQPNQPNKAKQDGRKGSRKQRDQRGQRNQNDQKRQKQRTKRPAKLETLEDYRRENLHLEREILLEIESIKNVSLD